MAGKFFKVSVTPTVSTSPAYTAGDQVGGLQTLTIPFAELTPLKLVGLTVLDKAAQSAALEVVFFGTIPTLVSVDNGAFDLTDANMALAIERVLVAATDYTSSSSNSFASPRITLFNNFQTLTTDTLYAAVKTTGTPTYAGTTDLVFNYVFERLF